jgi:hypothetical protein
MPINIDTDNILEPLPQLIILTIQFGDIITTDMIIQIKKVRIQYVEFIQSFYSSTGDSSTGDSSTCDFTYNPTKFRIEDDLLIDYQKTNTITHDLRTLFLQEVRPLTVSNTNISLLKQMDGSFCAIIQASIWSRVLNHGIKVNTIFEVIYTPHRLNGGHIYQIIGHDTEHDDTL